MWKKRARFNNEFKKGQFYHKSSRVQEICTSLERHIDTQDKKNWIMSTGYVDFQVSRLLIFPLFLFLLLTSMVLEEKNEVPNPEAHTFEIHNL